MREERERDLENNEKAGRESEKEEGKKWSENEPEWDFCSSVKKGFECI